MIMSIISTTLEVLGSSATVAGLLLGIAASAAAGMWIGSKKIRGVSLGVGGVMFTAMLWGWGVWHGHVEAKETIEFLRDFGLVLFVFAIGMQVGPGFLGRLRSDGLKFNLLAALSVILSCCVAGLAWFLLNLSGSQAVGVLSGAVTNTPGLAAASQAIKEIPNAETRAVEIASASYALAYPIGILGLIGVLIVLRFVCRKDPYVATPIDVGPTLDRTSVKIANPALVGKTVEQFRHLSGGKVIISRLCRSQGSCVPRRDAVLGIGDDLVVVGVKDELSRARALAGADAANDLIEHEGELQSRLLLVTHHQVVGRTLAELDVLSKHGVIVTRLIRAGIEMLAAPEIELHLGDRIRAVGTQESLERLAAEMGDNLKELEHPRLVPMLAGIALGVIIGVIPIALPGMPAPLKLGLAGGPLVIAILASGLGRVGRLDFYITNAAALLMRDLGIVLFLACVGLKAGGTFIDQLVSGDGWLIVGIGAVITIVPAVIVSIIARIWLKLPFADLAGLLAGSQTDPPALAFANATAGSEAPARVYATVYPLTMLMRVGSAQALVMLWYFTR